MKTVKVKAYKKLGPTGKVENVDAHLRKMDIGSGRHVMVRKKTDPSFVRGVKGEVLTHSTVFKQNISELYKDNPVMRQHTISKNKEWVNSKKFIGTKEDKRMLKILISEAENLKP